MNGNTHTEKTEIMTAPDFDHFVVRFTRGNEVRDQVVAFPAGHNLQDVREAYRDNACTVDGWDDEEGYPVCWDNATPVDMHPLDFFEGRTAMWVNFRNNANIGRLTDIHRAILRVKGYGGVRLNCMHVSPAGYTYLELETEDGQAVLLKDIHDLIVSDFADLVASITYDNRADNHHEGMFAECYDELHETIVAPEAD